MGGAADEELKIYHEGEAAPAALAGLESLFANARAQGTRLAVVAVPASPEALRTLAKRRHDLKAALRTLGFTVKALESGYTFRDDKAAAKTAAIAKAVAVLAAEGDVLARILAVD